MEMDHRRDEKNDEEVFLNAFPPISPFLGRGQENLYTLHEFIRYIFPSLEIYIQNDSAAHNFLPRNYHVYERRGQIIIRYGKNDIPRDDIVITFYSRT